MRERITRDRERVASRLAEIDEETEKLNGQLEALAAEREAFEPTGHVWTTLSATSTRRPAVQDREAAAVG
jgi:hypothetical protein